jgi:SDR family mycofactocin-dependent oxidoreductase
MSEGINDGRKSALITGAARGLGRALAIRLAEAGIDSVGVDIARQMDTVDYVMGNPMDLEETGAAVARSGARMITCTADVRRPAELDAAVAMGFEEFGRLDIVVANAAISPMEGIADATERVWRDVIDVNLTGAWNTVQASLPAMRRGRGGGVIIFTSSIAGLRGLGGASVAFNAYTASKHALVGLMRTLARELGPENIRVNSVHPAGMSTPMILNDAIPAFMATRPDYATRVRPALPGGVLDPRETANAIAWLASDEARYVTGVALPVDAGCVL